MNYEDALKEMNKKKKEDYFTLKLEYNRSLVIPYSQAAPLLKAIEGAEIYNDSYNDSCIKPAEKTDIQFGFMSYEEYRDLKIAKLLGISVDDLRKQQKGEDDE